ncbi:MAG: lysophospholipid acyltransferase family protein [Burkholderiales bacterium]|nr:lysophospholipid acyltransferase family protein [Burkholderiales bacterium]
MSALLGLAAHLPLALLHFLGTAAGWAAYALSPRLRRIVRANLCQAGYRDAATRRSAVAQAGKALFELPAIWFRSREAAARLVVEVHGWEHVERAAGAGRGFIVLTPHLGSWEIAGQVFSRGRALTVLYSPPKLAWLEPLMRAGRDCHGMASVPADMSGVRALYRTLRGGRAVGILPDQVPGVGEGEWTEFFARPAYTMTLAVRMAASTRAPVLVTFAERLPRGRGYRVHVEPLPERLADETEARRMNRALESLIRRCPGQYLWAYNRYKVPSGVRPPPDAARVCSRAAGREDEAAVRQS